MRTSVIFITVLGFVWSVASVAAQASPCPYQADSFAALPDGKSYAVAIGARDLYSGDLTLSLWSAGMKYAVDLKQFSIDKPEATTGLSPVDLAGRSSVVRAPLVVVALPAADEIAAVRLEPSDADTANGFACHASAAIAFPLRIAASPSSRDWYDRRRDTLLQGVSAPDVHTVLAPLGIAVPLTSCDRPYRDSVVLAPKTPDYPVIARTLGQTGTVVVRVTLAPSGKVVGDLVVLSSGSPSLDRAGLDAANASTYQSEVFRCEPQPSSYLFRSDFSYH